MDGYCLQGQPDRANELLNLMRVEGLKPNVVSYGTVINGYCKHKKVDFAWQIFEEMPHKGLKPDVCVYNAMIQGLFSVGRSSHALKIFTDMKNVGLVPDSYTYGIVLDGLLENEKFEDATLFYHEVDSKRLAFHLPFYNKFLHFLCNHNNLGYAFSIFNSLPAKGLHPDCKSYNIIICGCLKHGSKSDVMILLKEMAKRGFKLNVSTVSLLLDQIQGDDDMISLLAKLIPSYNDV
ncbi:hypothetical protein LIER_31620 [Lithospermum erythrorhizon]|uniref:Pentatricopeptide repeat-containing protein n=1 Tax=Lithospermum erythrorhizon TaxID=34254 RepID=A0AAV3RVB6_LITER